MSEPPHRTELEPPETFLSVFFVILGGLTLIASAVALLFQGFMAGLGGLAVAAIFFALGRILDRLEEINQRLRRLEIKSNKNKAEP